MAAIDWVMTLDDVDALHVPVQHRRCLFELWDSFPVGRDAKSPKRIRAFGYVIESFGRHSKVFLPLYEQRLSIFRVARWRYVDVDNCQLKGGA